MFEPFLKQQDQTAWTGAIDALLPSMHEVDRDATRIWFLFYPLTLANALASTDRPDDVARRLGLEGRFQLADQIDDSHWFLYGHRWWPEVKRALIERAEAGQLSSLDLPAVMREIARHTATAVRTTDDLMLGIVCIGCMTLAQVGISRFAATAPQRSAASSETPAAIVTARRRDDGQGLLGFLRGGRTQFSVRFDERRADAKFTVIGNQNVTTAAAADRRDYSHGPRPSLEGPIPVQCRSGSCGTCWVGVLGGAEKLSPVEAHEAKRMKEFGYFPSAEGTHPIIRLSCLSVAHGNVTIVIPPWNGKLSRLGG